MINSFLAQLLPAGATGTDTEAEDAPEVQVESIAERLPEINDWLPEALQPAWATISANPWVGALIVAAVFYVLAFVFRAILFGLLSRLATLTEDDTDDVILGHFRKPVFTTIFLFGLTIAVNLAQLPGALTLNKILLSVIVVSWMRAMLGASPKVLNALAASTHKFKLVEARTVPLLDLTSKLLLILIGSYALLMVWGINPVGWLASAGIVGIAVGFAARDTLANLFSGFFIVADSPYKIGDYVNLDSGERGRVSAIGLRSTRLLTRDDVEITIPNGVIAAAKIINESGGPTERMRVRVDVGVAYGSDLDRVCELLQEIGETHEGTSNYPKPRVRMRGFGASSIDFQLLAWIDYPEDRGRIIHELLMKINQTFADNNIEIPFSKHDVYVKEMPG